MFCLAALVLVSLAGVSQAAVGPCHEELRRLEARPPMLGQFRPDCSPNGEYKARQCHEATCFCVHRNGERIPKFEVHIADSRGMSCTCARDQAEYQHTGLLGRSFNCDSRGNYESVQCRGSVCFCADSNGEPLLGKEKVHISMVHKLSC